MLSLVQAEIIKQSKLGLVRVVTVAPLVASLLISALLLVVKAFGGSFGPPPSRAFASSGPNVSFDGVLGSSTTIVLTGIASLYALGLVLVAGLIITNEYSFSTIKMLATREPSRPRLILSKVIFIALYALLMIAVIFVSWLINILALKIVYGQSLGLVGDEGAGIGKGLRYLAFSFLNYFVWAMLGLALALRFKSIVAAVIIYFVYSSIDGLGSALGAAALNGQLGNSFPTWLDPLIQFTKFIAPFLINTSTARLTELPGSLTYIETVSSVQSFLVLLAWAALFVFAAIQIFAGRDITD